MAFKIFLLTSNAFSLSCKSLLALTTVIQSLCQPTKKKPQHINYRDSKLTRILQPHLSGNALIAILCCASRSEKSVEETRSTLKFASRAKHVKIRPIINQVIDDSTIIKRLQSQLYDVQRQLELTEKKLQHELAREARDPTLHTDSTANASQCSTSNSSNEYDRSNYNSNGVLPSIPQLNGKLNDKSQSYDSSASTEGESCNRPGANYDDISMNVCSRVSNPETIRGMHGESQDNPSPNGRIEYNLLRDVMGSNAKSLPRTGHSPRANEGLDEKMYAIPNEVIIMESVTEVGNNVCLTDRLKDYESRIEFLEEKLELSEDLIEVGLRDLERARHCIHDLVERNAKMKAGMSVREKMKKDYERGEIMVEHYWILRISLYSSIFFFLSGSGEYFLASAFFIWLALEMNVTA